MPAKLATLHLPKNKVFWNKCKDVLIFVHGVINQTFSEDSNYVIVLAMWPKFDNSSISMREVFITSILQIFDQKIFFFEQCSWFKFNNFSLALGTTLKLYNNVESDWN